MIVIRRLILVLTVVLTVGVGASGATYALWASEVSASGTVAAGTVGVTLSGTDTLAVSYTASTLSASAVVSVLNSGSVSADYSTSVSLAAGASSPLASGTTVTVWKSSGDCASPPLNATTGSWANVPVLVGTLAAAASDHWCVLTSLTSTQVSSLASTNLTIAFTATATIGSWTASSTAASFAQSVAAAAPSPAVIQSPPVNSAAWNLINTTTSPLCVAPIYTSGSSLVQSTCSSADNFQVWRFAINLAGTGEIIQRGWDATQLRWMANSASAGAAVTLGASSSTASQWKVSTNSNGTVSIALVSNPTLCAAVSNAATTSGTALVLTACAATAAQQFQVSAIANPSPPTIALVCSSENYNAIYAWPQLTGYAGSVIYRVRLGGEIISAGQYSGGDYYNHAVTFQNSISALTNDRLGDYAVAVEQSVNGASWTTTGTGTLKITPGTWGGKFVNCG